MIVHASCIDHRHVSRANAGRSVHCRNGGSSGQGSLGLSSYQLRLVLLMLAFACGIRRQRAPASDIHSSRTASTVLPVGCRRLGSSSMCIVHLQLLLLVLLLVLGLLLLPAERVARAWRLLG